jgi:hypothetical protein
VHRAICGLFITAVFQAAAPFAVAGQTQEDLKVHARIRVWAPDHGVISQVMQLVGIDSTGLTVRPWNETSEVLIPRDAVTRLQVSTGEKSFTPARGAALGAGIGMIAGVAIAAPHAGDEALVTGGTYLIGVGGGLAGGAILGLLIGTALAERWRDVRLANVPASGTMRLQLVGRGAEIGIRVTGF